MRSGEAFTDHFADAVWGGRRLSLVAARRFRDELLQSIEPDLRVRRRVPKHVRSETGIVGVSVERYVVGGRTYRRYVAHWEDPHQGSQRRRFSVQLYGEREARALAIDARERGVARSRAMRRAEQVADAARRLARSPAWPRRVKDPLSRKGIRIPKRRSGRQ